MKRKNRIFHNPILLFWKLIAKSQIRFFTLTAIFLFTLFLPGQNYYETLQLEFQAPLVRASEFDNFKPSKYPIKTGQELPPYVGAESAVVIDLESGTKLYELNPNERLYPASITKLMTALVALDYYQLDQILTVRSLAPVPFESDMGLELGDQLTLQNLLYGLLVPSGNDAAYTIAYDYPGGIENFIYAMNQKTKDLNMKNTHFENPSGFDSPDHYTTANDLSLLARTVLNNNFLNKVIATYGITLADVSGKRVYTLKNVNQFLGYLYGADGVKTGFTDLAGQCLVSSVSRDGHRIMAVVLKSQDRFGDSGRLIEWTYRNFSWTNITEIESAP